ncbi:hypothetical protein CRUP_031037, partial [Coryphaenoides rupestris]
QVTDRHGADGQTQAQAPAPDAPDAPTTGAKRSRPVMTDALRPGADPLAARADGDLPGASLQATASATTSALSDLSAALCETGGGSSSSSSSSPGLQGDLNAALFGMCVNSGLRDLVGTQGGALVLTFGVPESPLLSLKPTLLLAFKRPLAVEGLVDMAVTSQHLHPNTQTVCISGETRYVILAGRASSEQRHHSQKWSLLLETKSSTAGRKLQEILNGGGGGPGSKIDMTPFLVFLPESGPDIRAQQTVDTSGPGASSDTFSFLCELQNFLAGVSPQAPVEAGSSSSSSSSTSTSSSSSSSSVPLLQSLPPLALGPASSETLLATLLKSSSPTVFSFPAARSALRLGGHGRELALPPHLVEELGRKLGQAVAQVTRLMVEVELVEEKEAEAEVEEVEQGVIKSLERLQALSTFAKEEPPAGERQYRAFLLLKALQAVVQAYEVQRGLRAARAGRQQEDGVGDGGDGGGGGQARGQTVCGLQSLTVSLAEHLVGPDTADIHNCHGTCGYPLQNGNNHAILLNAQIRGGRAMDRHLCCVPVAYEDLQVVELNAHGTYLSIKPNMVAKECGCR